jgi:hypothetical protein
MDRKFNLVFHYDTLVASYGNGGDALPAVQMLETET